MSPSPVVVISTHLDDAVLSCAQTLLAFDRPIVATVFTDAPPVERHDGWNHATTGTAFAPDSQRVRRDEDAAALELVGAEACWLGEHEAEYRPDGQDVDALAATLRRFLDDRAATEVWAPLGIRHVDHIAVADAALRLVGLDGRAWRVYLDVPYAHTHPDAATARQAHLTQTGFVLTDHRVTPVTGSAKASAVAAYATQVDAVRGEHPAFDESIRLPEESWAISRSGPGAGRAPSTVA